ncbi:T9SS type A sorting domain-containing protein [Polaribacter sejongensis]|uniref:T9SS type A sorting domain-containing protein n=1 Tax=Polaribacter sejongensis TaxID=985043 RepID=UPI001AD81305|nr:T9SS type A sorting domain-containing protein [Polaribacter sejongensis]
MKYYSKYFVKTTMLVLTALFPFSFKTFIFNKKIHIKLIICTLLLFNLSLQAQTNPSTFTSGDKVDYYPGGVFSSILADNNDANPTNEVSDLKTSGEDNTPLMTTGDVVAYRNTGTQGGTMYDIIATIISVVPYSGTIDTAPVVATTTYTTGNVTDGNGHFPYFVMPTGTGSKVGFAVAPSNVFGGTSAEYSATIKLEFFEAGTYSGNGTGTPIEISPIFEMLDIDFDPNLTGTEKKEFVTLYKNDFENLYFSNNTFLSDITSGTNAVTVISSDSNNVSPLITDEQLAIRVDTNGITDITFTIGSKSGHEGPAFRVQSIQPVLIDDTEVGTAISGNPISANNDSGSVNKGYGGTAIANVVANDKLNSTSTTIGTSAGQVTLSQTSSTNAGIVLNTSTGEITVTTTVPAGTYSVVYEICEAGASPANCDSATAIVNVVLDTDNDGVPDATDEDDDNDGILDTEECTSVLTYNDSFEIPDLQAETPDLVSKIDGDGDTEIDFLINQTSVEGWVTTDTNTFDIAFDAFNASDGDQSIDLYGTPSATGIQKTFSGFTEGIPVAFSLDYSSVAGLFEATISVDYGDGPIFITTLQPNNIATSDSPNTAGSRIASIVWASYTANLLPTSTGDIKIIIQSTSLGSGQSGVLIDNVTLSQPTCPDTDGDSIPNHLDSDSDNDGCSDADEAYFVLGSNPDADTDNNGYYGTGVPIVNMTTGRIDGLTYTTTPNAYYLDAAVNTCNDSDNDGVPDALDLDSDNDGILDSVEINLNCPSTDYIDLGTTFTNTTTGTNGGNSSGTTSNLYTFEGVEASFSFETTNSATWASGVASAGPTNGIDGNYINVQPINTKFPLGSYYPADAANIDVAVYKLTFTKPVHNLEFKWGGLDNDDRVDFTANLNGTNVPLTITNNTLPSNSYTISGQSVTSTNAGSNAPNNSVIVSLTGPVTEIIFVAGKNNLINTASNVTMQLFELKYCLATDTDNDGIPNYLDLDSDGDGISDVIEAGGTDTDGDSMADGGAGITPTTSGIPSSAGTGQTPTSTDTDGIPNYLDLDSDNDGIYDILEAGGTDDNVDGIVDNTSDSDNDGLADIYDGSCVSTNSGAAVLNAVATSTSAGSFTTPNNATGSTGTTDTAAATSLFAGTSKLVLDMGALVDAGSTIRVYMAHATGGTQGGQIHQTDASGNTIGSIIDSYNISGSTITTVTATTNTATQYIQISTYYNNVEIYGIEIDYNIPPDCSGTALVPPETTSGTPDYLNTDSDGDLCTDAKEAGFTDANNDGLVDGTGGFTATGKVIGSDGYAGTSASVTDSTNNFACLDSDLDGVLDINDLDDDNDGILDSVELSTCAITKVEWYHNSPETPNAGTVNTFVGDSDYATYEDQALISSPNFTSAPNISFNELEQTGFVNNKFTYIISNATEATFTAAKAANKYVQVSYTPAVDLIASEIKLGWSTGAATANDDTFGNFDMAVEMDTNPSFESPTVKDQDFHIGEMIIDGYLQYEIPTTDYLVAGTTYYFRIYIYNNQNGTGFTRFDDISFEHRLICDADADGIPNHLDLDSDNDGITDVIEAGGTDANQDGKADDDDDNVSNTASNGIPTSAGAGLTPTTTDSDDLPDFLDIDADNDGIPDNIEAQPTSPYIAPSGIGSSITDINKNGVDDNYEVGGIGIIPVNTDVSNDAIPDYQDSDSDNDGIPDINENGDTDNILAGTDADSDGLDDNFDDFTDIPTTGFTVNNGINPPSAANLGDEDGDLGSGGEVDYRDFKDSDNDGISDANDLDDDNDGIPDSIENSSCAIEEKTEVVEILTEDFGTGTARETNAYILNHTYQPTGDIQDGFYAVASSLTSDLASFNRTNLTGDKDANVDQYTGPDNGSTNGRYLVINLKNQLDIEFYRQTLSNLIVGQDYRFRVDLAGICDGCDDAPIFELEIENPSGVIVEQLSSASLNVANDDVWKRVVLNFTAATTSLDIVIINHQPDGADGNDVGVDNIVLATLECPNTLDSDNDGIINSLDLDSDNDGIPDLVEAGGVDTDGNGRVDDVNANGTLINDLDGDGLDDRYDADSGASTNIITNPDTDGDGIKDFLDLDADNDGIPDIVEAGGTDANGDGKADGFIDNDKDGFNDLVDGDTNNDGTSDNILNALITTGDDANNDGVPDSYPNKDTDNDGIPNHADLDADNDGIADIVEAGGTDVNGDGRADNFIDVDKDGFNDIVDGDPTNILAVGVDTVGANTGNALIVTGTDGNNDGKPDTYPNGDTDKDGVLDIYDLDADNDGIPDVVEAGGTDENGDGKADNFVDADNDGFNDIVDGDPTNALAFGIDTVGANTSNVLIATGLDANGDGKPDSIPTGDTDGDGIRDNLDLDADNDGIPDVIEAGGTDANGDGRADDFIDTDKDGFNDVLDGDPTNALPNGTDTAGANTVNALILTSLDTDGDGNPDSYPTGDTDNDGIPNYLDLDADNDGIADAVEAGGTDENGDGRADDFVDADKDGFNDAVDGDPTNVLASGTDTAGANTTDTLILSGEDANGDGNPDTYSTGDTDNDGIPNHLDLDADNDGIADVVEAGGTDVNGDGRADNFIDADNDGFNDVVDGDPTNALTFGTDTAGANTSNVLIVTSADTDGDGNPDTYPNGDNDNDGILDHLDLDADNDGIADVVEAGGTDANGDGRADNFVDADNDGFNDIIDGDPTNALAVGTDTSGANTDNVLIITSNDSDGDGKPESYINGDTDNDGILDIYDLDADNDGIADVVEAGGTDVNGDGRADNFIDADNDGFNDVIDGDPTNALAIGIDTAGANTSNALILTGADTDATKDGKPNSYPNGDTDKDGILDHLDLDADNDGIADVVEAGGTDENGDGRADNFVDTDKDGFNDIVDGDPTNILAVGTDTAGTNTSDALIVTGTDANGDGNPDSYPNGDTDNDDIPNHLDLDADNDGIPDVVEAGGTDANGDGRADNFVDADNDGFNDVVDGDPTNALAVGTDTVGTNTANALISTSADSDGDGNPDTYPNGDTDKDGILDHLDLDADNDGIADVVEVGGTDENGDGRADNFVDADNDGFNDVVDGDPTNALAIGIDTAGANTSNALILTGADTDATKDGKPNSYPYGDTDKDGILDHLDLDADNDGIPDVVEAGGTDENGDGRADNFVDADNDGFNDVVDGDPTNVLAVGTDTSGTNTSDALIVTGTDANGDGNPDTYPNGDTDKDGIPNHLDLDADNDGIADVVEAGGTDANGDGRADDFVDADNDGFNDIVDGDPTNILTVGTDTNGANTSDALILTGTDANGDGNPDTYPNGDTDADGILDHLDLDADNDGIADVVEAGGTDANGDGRADNFIDADNDGFNDVVDGDPTNALVVGTDTVGTNTTNTLIITSNDSDGNGKPESYINGDTDKDGILNHLDLDADNDGIADVIEAGGTDTDRDGKADGILDVDNDGFNDLVDGDPTNSLVKGTDSAGTNTANALIVTSADDNNDGRPTSYLKGDADTDGKPNFLDIDADDDGIPDNIEGQPSVGYISPSEVVTGTIGIIDTNNNGVDDKYEVGGIGFIPENTDGTDNPDYLDSDSDNDGVLDIKENGDTNHLLMDLNGLVDTDGDGLNNTFDDNTTNTNGATVNDGVGSNDKIIDEASLEDAFGDTDNDFNPGAGDLDYRDIPDPADVMITQVYQFGDEKWIEITNIGEIDIPANTIKIQLYKDKTIAQMIAAPLTEPTVSSITVGTILLKGKSVLFKNTTNSIVPDETNSGVTTVTSAAVDLLTDLSRDETDQTTLNSSNDIITLSTGIGAYSWNNRYDIASNIGNKTSVVRIDERLTTNKDYDVTEWVVFIDDAITPYQPVGTEAADIADIVRHPQDPLISEITSSSIEANTLLGLHRIDITTSNSSSNTWTNGFPDRSRSVVIDQDFEHTTNRLSARKLKVDTGVKLAVTDQLLVVTNNITLDGNIRLVGTSQLVQTHTTIPQISGTGKLLVDQNSETPSLYRYGYMSSPVNSSGFIYLIKDVLKDGTTPLDATSTVGTQVAKNINFISGYDGDTTDPISLADYWIYTYSPESNGRSNWTHKNEDKPIDRGDGYIFKGPGEVLQNYTFVGTPNDGEFYTVVGIGANEDYLIGNPFPSAMNARKFMEDNDGSIKQTLYFWEHHESAIGEGNGIDGHIFGGYIGGYATLNLSTGTAASAIAENSSNGTSGLGGGTYKEPEPYIAIAQGFFVEGNGTGGVIKFDNSQRAYVTEGTESIFFKGSAKSSKAKTGLLPIIKLGFEFKNTEDLLLHNQIAISFQETNSFDYDKGYDSEIYEVGKTDFYWKFPEDETKYVIAGVQEISNELEVPLEIIMDYSGQVTLMVDEIINIDNGIYITDKLTGTSYNVKQGRTTLTLEKGLYTGRFVLAFKETSALSVEDDILAGYTSIYADNENHNIVISKNQDIEINKVELFDILGKKVSLWKIKEQKSTYQLEIKKQIPTGIYIVKMKTNKGEMNKKVVIE